MRFLTRRRPEQVRVERPARERSLGAVRRAAWSVEGLESREQGLPVLLAALRGVLERADALRSAEATPDSD